MNHKGVLRKREGRTKGVGSQKGFRIGFRPGNDLNLGEGKKRGSRKAVPLADRRKHAEED
jgi:hypothetical protein